MSTELLIEAPGSDKTSDVARVVEATRHLHHFREGQSETLQWMAEHSVSMTLIEAFRFLEPPLRILGPSDAGRFAERLHRIANDAVGDWRPDIDQDRAAETLRHVVHEAVTAICGALGRSSCICHEVTR